MKRHELGASASSASQHTWVASATRDAIQPHAGKTSHVTLRRGATLHAMRLASMMICALPLLTIGACKTTEDPSGSADASDSSDTADTSDSGGEDELPEGWENAQPIALAQAPASGGCDSGTGVSLEVGLVAGRVQAVVDGLMTGCGEGYEGFVRERDGGGYDLLVQPIDMHPLGLPGCVCNRRFRGVLGNGEVGMPVDVYRRVSFEEDPAGTVDAVGSATIEDVPAGCAALEPCDAQTPCSNEGNEDPNEYWDICVDLQGCGGSVCVSHEEACMIDCGVLDCVSLESNPEQVSCE
jgi:hypothetical protein